MDYVKSARKNLIIAQDQIKYYQEDLNKDKAISISSATGIAITKNNTQDAVTTITSKDIEDSYQKENKKLESEISNCVDTNGNKAVITNAEKCKEFISTDKEDKTKALTEFGLRQFALEKTMKDKFSDRAEVVKYLKDEGYDQKKIDSMISNNIDLEAVKKEIQDRYSAEKNALIATMAKKIEAKTTKQDGFDKSNDADQMSKIKTEITSRPDELKQLVHFDNVVSSYLEIDKGDKTKSRNVASLFAELDNGSSSVKGAGSDQLKEIRKNAEEAGLKASKGTNDEGTTLTLETLNGLFKHSTEK
jgi:hypothetical protein